MAKEILRAIFDNDLGLDDEGGLVIESGIVRTRDGRPIEFPDGVIFNMTLTFTEVVGSPFTLTSSWVKVATTTNATRALRIEAIASATTYDIEWTSVTAGASAPTATYGSPVLAGEDFATGIPLGDIYLKSATGQIAIVKTGA